MKTTKPLGLFAVLTLALTSSSLVGQTRLDPANPAFNAGNGGQVKVFLMGPYTIPAGRMINGKMIPGERDRTENAPNPGDVWMTSFSSRIVDVNRVPQDPKILFLHHAVLLNRGQSDLTCSTVPGERFAGAGSERIPIMLPPGYGYRIKASDPIICFLHIQNFTTTPKKVYYQFSMTLLPATAKLQPVRTWWLDIVNCRSTYIIPRGKGQDIRSNTYTVPGKGIDILTMSPHLHCYGAKLEIIDTTTSTQKMIRSFTNRRACPVDMLAVLNPKPISLATGTQVTIRAFYNKQQKAEIDAMGIMIAFIILK